MALNGLTRGYNGMTHNHKVSESIQTLFEVKLTSCLIDAKPGLYAAAAAKL